MKHSLLAILAFSLTAVGTAGCSSIPGTTFDNRIVCTIGKDKAYFVSLYGPIGVAANINSGDAAVMCPNPTTALVPQEVPEVTDSGINLDQVLPVVPR